MNNVKVLVTKHGLPVDAIVRIEADRIVVITGDASAVAPDVALLWTET